MKLAERSVLFVSGRRAAFALAGAAWLAFALWLVSRAEFSENALDLLPVSDPAVEAHKAASELFGQTKKIFFNVSGDGAEAACAELSKKLSSDVGIASVSGEFQPDVAARAVSEAAGYVPFIFSEKNEKILAEKISEKSLEERMKKLARALSGFGGGAARGAALADPAGISEIFFAELAAASSRGALGFGGAAVSPDGKNRLVVAEGAFDSADSAKSAALEERLEKYSGEVLRAFPGAKIARAGGCRVAADNAAAARSDCAFCLALSLAAMAAMAFAAFSRARFAILALVPSIFGTSAAFVFLASFGKVSAIAAGFASIAVGVSIDYCLHILYRLGGSEKIAPREAGEAAAFLSRPIAAAAGTTALAFAIIFALSSGGFSQLGIFGAIGVAVSALLGVFVMPAFAAGGSGGEEKKRRRVFDVLAEKIAPLLRRKKACAAAAVLISAALFPFIPRVGANGDFSSLSALSPRARADADLLRGIWGGAVSQTYVLARGKTVDDAASALARAEKFLEKSGVEFRALSPLIPTAETRAENAARWKNFWTAERAAAFRANLFNAAKSAGLKPAAFARYKIPDAESGDIFSGEVLRKMFSGKFAQSGECAAAAICVELGANADKSRFARELSGGAKDLSYIDPRYLGERVAGVSFEWALKFALAASILAAAYLYALERSAKFVLS
ncbi:MAG: MMPL family transporter, partial [Opitutales bacterium]|nr:MMPL family transporter [Opitutales bacterium]